MHFFFTPASVRVIKSPSGWFEHRGIKEKGKKGKAQQICSTSSPEETWHGRIILKCILKLQIMKITRGRCCEFYKFSGSSRYVIISSIYVIISSRYVIISSIYVIISSRYVIISSIYVIISSRYVIISSRYVIISQNSPSFNLALCERISYIPSVYLLLLHPRDTPK